MYFRFKICFVKKNTVLFTSLTVLLILLYVWVHIKTIPWKFCILNPRNSRVIYTWSLCFFLKNRLLFNKFYCFSMFVNKHFISRECITQNVNTAIIQNLWHIIFMWRKKVAVDFQICISVPLTHFSPVSHFYTPWKGQKTKGFLTFSGVIEIEHWTKLG